MNKLIETLDGLKTHLTCATILVLLVCHWAGWMQLPVEAYASLFALALIFLREGVKKSGPVAMLALMFAVSGCTAVKPGNDPLVVRAEQIEDGAFDTADRFLQWETVNRATVGKDVREFANKLRVEFPKADRALRASIKTYKANRSAENKATLETVIKTIETMMQQIGNYLPMSAETKESSVGGAFILALLSGVIQLLGLINGRIDTAKRDSELTPEEELEIDKKREEAFKLAHWQVKD